jgi:hypothetical protein
VYAERNSFDVNGAGILVKTPDGKSRRLTCSEESPDNDLYSLGSLGLRVLPEESLVSVDRDGLWPGDSPNTDLLQGTRTHDIALITRALNSGADPNFHSPYDLGALGAVADNRPLDQNVPEIHDFDAQTDRIVALLLSRGASPTISLTNGVTAVDWLAAKSVPTRTLRTLLDAGWPRDPQYRLHAGAVIGDAALIKESLDQGADPNMPFHGGRIVASAIIKANNSAYLGMEAEQQHALAALEILLQSGAKLDEGTPGKNVGDIVSVYSNASLADNLRPELDLLIRYSSPAGKENALNWLRPTSANTNPKRKPTLDWLLDRLAH